MNKQLILLAALLGASQASMNAFESDAAKTAENMRSISAMCKYGKDWVVDAAQTSRDYVANIVAPATKESFKNASTATYEAVKAVFAQAKDLVAKPCYWQAIKQHVVSAKDTTVNFVTSFNRPSWQSTKDFALQAKNATVAAASNAYESIKTNAPVYAEKAQEFAKENKVALGVTLAAAVGVYTVYQMVKYVRENCNRDQVDQYVDNVKDTLPFKK